MKINGINTINNINKKKKNYPYHQDQGAVIGAKLNFAVSEAYKLLRTNLIFSMTNESKCKIIGITSALSGEGKSTTAINLAYTIAEADKKVLLMEADMRIPVAAGLLELEKTPGLSHVLAGVSQLKDAIVSSVLQNTLSVLPAGEIPPNPSELLSSKRMVTVLSELSESFDYIIVDLPPITAVSDGLAISKLLSGMVVVVRQNYCDQHALSETMRQMEFLKVKVLGFVMNYAETKKKRYKKNSYGYQYGHSYSFHRYKKEKPQIAAESETMEA